MGERKAVNKYYPPDWTPEQGSLDRYHGQHPLRERARKLGQGILIIRFEMPYNIWCGGCGIHIGMGVRYNAEKKRVGNYYTTPIYRFRMKCHLCDNHFEIETDPKNCDYVIVSGARRKEERWDQSATEAIALTDKEDVKKMAVDAMFKLEHGVQDEQKSKEVLPTLEELKEVQSVWSDDYAANQLLRKRFREEKREIKVEAAKDSELKERGALDIALVPERSEDIELARRIRYHGQGFDAHRRKRRTEVNTRPLFDSKAGKNDAKREKVKELLGKRKQMQFSHFTSHSKTKSDLSKLGIKVRRNRSRNSESSDNSVDKDPSVDTTSGKLHSQEDSELTTKEAANTEARLMTDPEVTSQTESHKQTADRLGNQAENISSSSTILLNPENHNSQKANSDSLTVNSNPSVSSLVCCDYADSSDASDDLT
ncbi:coiled-coil domain-containing protein 130 homolog [Oculina patagonica]